MGATEAAVAGFYARQALEKKTEECDRYKTERDELLAAFFETYDTRQHIYQAILAGDPDAEQILESGQTGPSQSG